ncbi:uncharacterized protein LOC132296269 [Cornus florida]|uniref:uncharacterized protein LOC132296269 n=1 Tax=Cornus florida TaxID=4283 RepID=UPI0028A2BA24|nr:uncharacterized protein LOC132296269 [Cornus florida]
MVNTGRGQNLNSRQRRAARRQQEHLQRQQIEEEQQRLGFQDEGQLQEEQEEVQQASALGRDPEYQINISEDESDEQINVLTDQSGSEEFNDSSDQSESVDEEIHAKSQPEEASSSKKEN